MKYYLEGKTELTCHPFASAIALALVGVRDRAAARTRFDNILDDAESVSSYQREGEGEGDRRCTRGALPTSASDDDDDLAFGKGRLVRVWLRWLSDTVRLSALLLFQSLTTYSTYASVSWCIVHLLRPVDGQKSVLFLVFFLTGCLEPLT